MIRRLFRFDRVELLFAICRDYRDVVRVQQEVIMRKNAELSALQLAYTRHVRDLVTQFVQAQEAGTDLREILLNAINDLDDEIARLEEHAPVGRSMRE